MTILTLYKIDFRTKRSTRDAENIYILTKGSVHKGDITILKTVRES